jgi:hypothetical protein
MLYMKQYQFLFPAMFIIIYMLLVTLIHIWPRFLYILYILYFSLRFFLHFFPLYCIFSSVEVG